MSYYNKKPTELEDLEIKLNKIITMLKSMEHYVHLNKRWLDSSELCLFLNISKETLKKYRAKGLLAYSVFDKKCYYRLQDVLDMLNRNYRRRGIG